MTEAAASATASSSRTQPDAATHSSNTQAAAAGGLFSYIRLGTDTDRRLPPDFTSSPTLSHPTGHYIWDFLNWGFTTPYGLKQFSEVTPSETDIVPYGNMDQGRLFVRVSVQDLSTLQLAYQSGLAALQKAQSKVDKLSDENHRLQAMVKSWTIKTTALTTESIELRQEINSIRKKMKLCTVSIEEHKDLITALCENICKIFSDNRENSRSPCFNFDDLVKIIFSLPPLVQERLSESCPSFTDFMQGGETGLYTSMQMADARRTIERILNALPLEMEAALLKTVIKEFALKHGALPDAVGPPNPTRQRSNTDPVEVRKSFQLVEETLSAASKQRVMYTGPGEETPEKRHSIVEVPYHKRPRGAEEYNMRDPVMSPSYHNAIDQHLEVESSANRDRSQAHQPDFNKSGSSSIGTPLAHSTPCGTMSRLVSTRIQPTNQQAKPAKKKKVSRWNLAARICSTGKSPTLSDSDSFDKTYTCTTNHLLNTNNHLQGRRGHKKA